MQMNESLEDICIFGQFTGAGWNIAACRDFYDCINKV
jgi:hypothetical protein